MVQTQPAEPTTSVSDELGVVFAGTTGGLLTHDALSAAVLLVTSVAVASTDTASGAALTVVEADGAAHAVAATDAVAERLQETQSSAGAGPGLTAWAGRTTARSDDLRHEDRWPQWSPTAVELRVLSVMSAPIVAGDEVLGAICLYSHQAAVFGDREEQLLTLLAAQAAFLLKNARVAEQAGRVSQRVRAALRRRDVINRATGILMSRDTVPADMAFARLVGIAERDGKPVHEVASKVVATVSRQTRR